MSTPDAIITASFMIWLPLLFINLELKKIEKALRDEEEEEDDSQ